MFEVLDMKSTMIKSNINNIYRKFFVVLAGMVISLILIELGIRAGGYYFKYRQNARNIASISMSDNVRILCLGDSTTADGYPEVSIGV